MKKEYLFILCFLIILFSNSSFGQFQKVYTVPYFNEVKALASNKSFVFAGTGGNGIVRSSNNGDTWSTINNGIPGWYYFSLLSVNDTLFAGSFGYVYQSTNNGNSWVDMQTGLGLNDNVVSLAIKGKDLYAGVIRKGIYSNHLGSSVWNACSTGLPDQCTVNDFMVIGSDIYAATNSGVYKSVNNAASWILLTNGLPSGIQAYKLYYHNKISRSDNDPMFVGTSDGIYRTTNYGDSWISSGTGLAPASDVVSFSSLHDTIFAGTYDSLYASINMGVSWFPVNDGLPGLSGVTLMSTQNDVLFASASCYIYRHPYVANYVNTPLAAISKISAYPNPCKDNLTIEIPQPVKGITLTIVNTMGAEVFRQTTNESKTKVKMSNLAPGVYFVKLINSKQINFRMIIKE